VTAGKGIIATETEQQIIVPGDVVHIPSEEEHWRGATPDSAFSHIALPAKGSTTTQVEKYVGGLRARQYRQGIDGPHPAPRGQDHQRVDVQLRQMAVEVNG
jgi:4-carboxymuconolactone decarboxylase